VPVFRYFVVIGCCLIGLLFASDYLFPKETAPAPIAAAPSSGGSLASWRQTQQRLDKPQESAVVYPTVAPLPPTPERLAFERQLTLRAPDRPADAALQARAELPATAAEAIAPPAAPAAPTVMKKPSKPKTVAHVQRRERPHYDRYDRPNYAAAYPPAPASQFGGYRQAQYDRPFGGFFGRMF